jgi:endonuclease/exonuclease/phosphatase family metal-dependent hydrolase
MPSDKLWLIVGDFNLIRHQDDRNKPDGDINLMMKFNEALSNLDLLEVPLHGLTYTWSNKQREPLLQRLDWFFISQEWSVVLLETQAKTLPRDISDHVPYLVSTNPIFQNLRYLDLRTSGWSLKVLEVFSRIFNSVKRH